MGPVRSTSSVRVSVTFGKSWVRLNAEIRAARARSRIDRNTATRSKRLRSSSLSISAFIHTDPRLDDERAFQILESVTPFVLSSWDGVVQWHEMPWSGAATLIIPISPIPGQGRFFVLVIFENASPKVRLLTEKAYMEQKPLADAFFRLWQTNRSMMQREEAFETVLNCTETGVILIDNSGKVCFANSFARNIFAKNDGLVCVQDILRASSFADSVNLQAALNHLTVGGRRYGCE
jgi:PAS domain-containing protein